MPCKRVVAVIMAAGSSRRFGEQDKRRALLAGGETLLNASFARAVEAFTHCRVVLRDTETPAPLGLAEHASVIGVAHADRGLGTSLAEAFATLAGDPSLAEVQAAAILLGDMPAIRVDTLRRLQHAADTAHILRPCHASHPGHPVLFGRAFWPALTRLDGDAGARRLIRQHPERCRTIEVDDPGILLDVDTPADLQFEIRNTDAQVPY
ncbi:molybdenum cofactor cytidylyltransferase [Chromohalobacter marismortui]|uniref:Molybdenum cofactor cytidylyltransferase n=1 Tax=Chromohalobacter marismortui TaxID=42055 RepID=A0A4R7NT19_9GAMM|nr:MULTISPECIES: nucleotidyltransferase family protein [Chromohalobacter]MCI0509013.1 nucleotidyltransferase family protein [Chromohalobacter sp.]MCI0592882.1 nucleotidyltransferase family protein [Chromohalobacter sp.]TDU24097.1 molybdenum cofactor cytidylyltransferase [Chromohalobacter marismortui]